MALLAALLLVPAAAHAAGPIEIIRDCEDDGVLQGDYTAAELRKARSELPTDIDEYSDCRDVLGARDQRAKTSSSRDGDDDGGGGTGGGGGTNGGDGDRAGGPRPATPTPEERVATPSAIVAARRVPQDARPPSTQAAEAGERSRC